MKYDKDLLTALNERDPTAFGMIYHQYYAIAAKVAGQFFRDESEIESIVHDAILKFWNSGPTLVSDVSIAPFLRTITRNLCYDIYRQQKRVKQIRLVFPEVLPETQEDIALQTDPLIRTAVLKEVVTMMESLPSLQRNVLRLYYFEKRKIFEIAELLGKPSTNIRNAKAKGLENLKEMIRKKFPHSDFEGVIWPFILLVLLLSAGS